MRRTGIFILIFTGLMALSGCTGNTSTPTSPDFTRTIVSETLVCNLESKAIASPIIYSPDSRHVAYIAADGEKRYVIIDGVAGEEFDIIYPDFGMFSPDGARVAYKATNYGENPPSDNTYYIVIDGERGDGYYTAGSVTFSPDSKHVAYIADGNIYIDREQVQVAEGAVSETNGLVFSPDGSRLAYVINTNEKQCVVVDGTPGEAYQAIRDIVFSPDGNHLAYAVQTGDGWCVVRDGVSGTVYYRVENITWSPDSSHLAYSIRKKVGSGTSGYAVLDGNESKEYNYSGVSFTLAFSPDSQHFAYSAGWIPLTTVALSDGIGLIAVDNEERDVTNGHVSSLMFSPDGKRIVFFDSTSSSAKNRNHGLLPTGKN